MSTDLAALTKTATAPPMRTTTSSASPRNGPIAMATVMATIPTERTRHVSLHGGHLDR